MSETRGELIHLDDYRIKKDEPQTPTDNGIRARLKRRVGQLLKPNPDQPYVPHRGELGTALSKGEIDGIGKGLSGNINSGPITTMDVGGQPNPAEHPNPNPPKQK